MIKKKEGYKAPPRTSIVKAVSTLLPDVPVERLQKLDFSALYAIHSEIIAYGLPPAGVAELNIPGYRCGRDVSTQKKRVKQFRQDLKKQLKEEERRKKEAARARARAGKERARLARQRARNK
jgi:hypothetical protein